jgi:hypothetical protein
MKSNTEKQETYREQLARLAQSLAVARSTDLRDDLAAGSPHERIRMFVEGNLDKRFEKLQRQVEFVAQVFPDFEDLLTAFVRAQPLAAYDTGSSDGERFLAWVEQTQQPLPEQRDYISCQRARHAVENEARRNRVGYLRFQELLGVAETLADELESNPSLVVCLNPIRVWGRFETPELLDPSASLPAEVIFYPVAGDIRTAVLEGESLERVRELAGFGPCTLDAWRVALEPFVGTEGVDRTELVALCRDLVAIGLVAFA